MASKRLFLGMPIPAECKEQLRQFVSAHESLSGWRWTRPDTWHITVYFFGSVQEEMIGNLGALISLVVKQQPSFTLEFDNYVPAPRPQDMRMIWARYRKHADFRDLVSRMHEAFTQIQPGVQIRKSPIPHITLARRKGDEARFDTPSSFPILSPFPLTELILWESLPQNGQTHYEPLAQWRFVQGEMKEIEG